MTEEQAQDRMKTASAPGGLPQPPAANQGKDEPIAASPDASAQASAGARDEAAAGSSSLPPGGQGEPPRPMEVADVRAAANMSRTATIPARAAGGVPTPGDAKGVAVPSVQAAAGTSEQTPGVDGVRITAIAPPGKPDGEVDTRA